MKEALIDKVGFSEAELKILLDNQATKENVVKAFTEWLIRGTKPGDTALFYFSGHGIQVWDENGHEIQDGKGKALICFDSNLTSSRSAQRTFRGRSSSSIDLKDTVNALLGDEIHKLLSLLSGRKVIFISDSCHSGSVYKALAGEMVLTKNFRQPVFSKGILGDRFSVTKDAPLDPDKPYIGGDLAVFGVQLAAFTACENSQTAEVRNFTTDPKGAHSVFTWYLYNALEGKGDASTNGKVTFAGLSRYIQDSVKRDGFPQIPQSEFQPENLADEAVYIKVAKTEEKTEEKIRRPVQINYFLSTVGDVPVRQRDWLNAEISKKIPALRPASDKKDSSVYLILEKRGNLYFAQMSDWTGATWDSQQGSSVEQVLPGLLGNLRAYYVQTALSALKNPGSKTDFTLNYKIRGTPQRAEGEVLNGDAVVLNAGLNVPGYLYVVSVDNMGILHPLYPMPRTPPEKLEAGRPKIIGSDGSITIQEPFGKEMVFALLSPRPAGAVASFWDRDDIGDLRDSGVSDQNRFLDVLWSELISAGKPTDAWNTKVLFLRSFPK